MYVAKVKITGEKIMKRFLTIALALTMMLTVCAFALELDTAEAADEVSVTDEAVFAGTKGDGDGKPGINIITGTTDAYDFEDENYEHAILVTRTEGIIADPDNADNRVMWIGSKQYSNIGITPIPKSVNVNSAANQKAALGAQYPLLDGKTFESARPFTLKFDFKGTKDSAYKLDFMSGIGNAKVNGGNGWTTLASFSIQDGMNWKPQTYKFTYAKAIQSTKTFVLCFHNGSNATGTNFYVDNIEIIPDYRVAYYDVSGQILLSSEYLDYTSTTYEIPAEKYAEYEAYDKFLGFKFAGDDDSKLIEGTITLANEDLEIVPVFDTNVIAPEYISAAEGTTLTVTSKLPVVKWSISDDFAATLTGGETSATLTAKGYSGAVVVTATGDGWEESVTVHLKGGTKFRPGVNFGTGTTEPITFEEGWEVYSLGRDTQLIDIESAPVDNGTDKVVYFKSSGTSDTAQNYPQIYFTTFDYKTLESDRPLQFEFDYTGSFQNIWPLDFSGNSKSLGGGSSATWKHFTKSVTKTATTVNNGFQWGKLLKNAVYVDNLALTPYYKITYMDAAGAEASYEYALPADRIFKSTKTLANTATQKFIGWSTTAGAAQPMSSFTLGNEDITLYPVYADAFTVNYYGYDGNVAKSEMIVAGEDYALDYALADVAGKYFEGWKVEGTEDAVTSVKVTSAINLVPVYTTEPVTMYVSSSGSDTTGKGTEAAPFATLAPAYKKLHDGSTIVLLDNATFVNPPAHNGALTIKGATSSVTLTLPSEISLAGNLKLDNLTLTTGTFYANGYKLEISSSVTSTGALAVYGGKKSAALTGNTDIRLYGGKYSTVYGGGNGGAVNGDTNVIFGGNATQTDKLYIYGGCNNAAVNGTSNITLEGNATCTFLFGAGNSTNGIAKVTNVYINGGTVVETAYGGSNTSTAANDGAEYNFTMTGGKITSLIGANHFSPFNGNVFVNVFGGEITRRIYTGCYNNASNKLFSYSYDTDHYVTGTTVLRLAPGASVLTGSDGNRGIFSGSRTAAQHDAEQNTIIYLDGCYNTYSGKIGEQGWIGQSSFKSHHDYVVQATAGGDVLGTKTAGKVYIAPDEGKWGVIGTETYCNEEAPVAASTSITFENYYTVTYYGFDGEVLKSEDVLAGEYALDLVLEDENGKYFEGWKVEGTKEAVTSVNVTADVNIYPVFVDKTEAFENVQGNEMRFDGENATASIRFKSVITAEEKNEADEFGFIVTRKSYLDKMAELGTADETLETELTFDFKYKGDDLFVSGMAYQKDENGVITVEKIVEEDENGNSIFATVLTGIDNTKADQVNEIMVVRPYVKFTNDGKQFTFYGATAENSLVGVAKTVDTTELPENVKASIEAIVALEK